MPWVRRTTERPERRPGDIARLVTCGFGVVIVGVWAQTQSTLDTSLFRSVNTLPNGLDGAATAFYALGSIWVVVAVAAVLLALRRWSIALAVAVAGGGGWGIAVLLNDLLGNHSTTGLTIHVRTGSGPAYPSANVAVIAALLLALSPYLVRPLRRLSILLVATVGLAAMYLGTAFTSDAIGGFVLGLAAGSAVLVTLGAPGGRPSRDDIRESLTDLGFEVTDVQPSDELVPRAAVMDVTLTSGEPLRVTAFGRDQRDGQLAYRLWRRLAYREPRVPIFGSRLQQVEHTAYMLLLAADAKVRAPTLVKTASGPDAALLVTHVPRGTPLRSMPPEQLTDRTLGAVWGAVSRLHQAGLSHGNLDIQHILVNRTSVAFDGFTSADAASEQFWRDRDTASVLVGTATLVGNDRAIRAAVEALGKESVGSLIPLVQPVALPAATRHSTKHTTKLLKALRADLAKATGAQDVAPLNIRRLTWTNLGMLAGVLIALGIAIPSLQSVNFSSLQSEFSNATWGWVVAAALVYPTILMSWATALTGAVNADLPFVPTTLVQLACTFLNFVTPNGIGGTALQVDYLHHEDVPVSSAASAMVLSTGMGSVIQIVLLVAAAALTSSQLDFSSGGGSASLAIIALVGAGVGAVLLIPKVRGKVLPAARRAGRDIWAVVRDPHKALRLIGGNLGGNLLYPAVLGLCLLAFGHSLGFAQLIVVQIGAGMLGNVAPVPGGIGIQEAALTAGLTGFGIPNAPALASVIVFRTITFAIPPIFGFFTLRWLRAQGYA